MPYTVITTAEKFTEFTGVPALVMFGSPGCPWCIKGKKPLREFAEKFPRLNVGFVDIERSPVLAGTQRINELPTYVVFGGKRKKRAAGLHELDDLVALVEKALK